MPAYPRIERLARAGLRAHAHLCRSEGVDPQAELTEAALVAGWHPAGFALARLAHARRGLTFDPADSDPNFTRMTVHGEGRLVYHMVATGGRPKVRLPAVFDALAAAHAIALDEWPTVEVVALRTRSPHVLTDLAGHPHDFARAAVASNRYTPERVVEQLAGDPEVYVRIAVAKRPTVTAAAQLVLALDTWDRVRQHLAMSPVLDPDVARGLAADTDVTVRLRLARNEATPTDVLDKLATDRERSVRARATQAAPARMGRS